MPHVKPLWQETSGSAVLTLKLNAAFSFGLALVFVLLLLNALLAERQSRQELATAHEQLRHYALRIENQATLQERNRIAREIHDSLGHALTAQSIQLENALLFLQFNTEKSRDVRDTSKTTWLPSTQRGAPISSNAPFPIHLGGKSLSAAIATLVNEFRSLTGIAPDCTINLPHPLTTEVSTAIYRILQEGLVNQCTLS